MNSEKIAQVIEKLPELATELDEISRLIHRKARFALGSDRTLIQARLIAAMMAVREVESAIIPNGKDGEMAVQVTGVVTGKGTKQQVLECVAETYRRALYDTELVLYTVSRPEQTEQIGPAQSEPEQSEKPEPAPSDPVVVSDLDEDFDDESDDVEDEEDDWDDDFEDEDELDDLDDLDDLEEEEEEAPDEEDDEYANFQWGEVKDEDEVIVADEDPPLDPEYPGDDTQVAEDRMHPVGQPIEPITQEPIEADEQQ